IPSEPLKVGNSYVYFSPRGGCTDAIVKEVDAAMDEVYVLAYSFTSDPIREALERAHKRGVYVVVIADEGQFTQQYSDVWQLMDSGIITRSDGSHSIQHNKVILIDKEILITGSFNFSDAAEKSNAENLLVIKDSPELCRNY